MPGSRQWIWCSDNIFGFHFGTILSLHVSQFLKCVHFHGFLIKLINYSQFLVIVITICKAVTHSNVNYAPSNRNAYNWQEGEISIFCVILNCMANTLAVQENIQKFMCAHWLIVIVNMQKDT